MLHTPKSLWVMATLSAMGTAASGPVLAEDTTETTSVNPRMGQVVVTANRAEKLLSTIPNTVTVIDKEELDKETGMTPDLSTILGNEIPSFAPSRQKLTSYGETLRGRDPLYLVDGVPQSNPLRDGSRDGHTIDPLMLETIEVIHGANAIHGMGASGGIINLITKNPTEAFQQSLRLEAFFQEDSSNSLGYGMNYGVSGTAGAFDGVAGVGYRYTGVGYDANGDIIGFDTAQGDTMDAEMDNLFLKGGYNWDDQRLELTYNYFNLEGRNEWVGVDGDIDAGIPTTAEKGNPPGKPPSNEVTMLNFTYSNEEIFGHSLRLQTFYQEFAGTFGGGVYDTFQDPAYPPDLYEQSQNNSEKIGMKLTLEKKAVAGLPVNLVYGLDYLNDTTNQKLIFTPRKWVPDTEYDEYAPFLQAEYTGIDNLVITGGVRYEEAVLKVNDFTTLYSYNGGQSVEGGEPEFNDTLFNLGATYQLSEQWRVYGNYSQGFSMPDVGRVLRGINQPNQSVETFLDLEPIITDNYEVGAELNTAMVSAQVAYFISDSDFGSRLQADANGIYSVVREKTEIEGFEIRVDVFATDEDTLRLTAAYLEGQSDTNDDGEVDTDLDGANMAPNRLNLSWDRYWTDLVSSRIQMNHVYDRNFKDLYGNNYEAFDGYTTLDLITRFDTDVGNIQFSIQNLTNTDYFTYYSQTLGNDARNFKGLGRSYTVTYSTTF